jgi:hypothetical protein
MLRFAGTPGAQGEADMDVHEVLSEIRALYVRDLVAASLEGDFIVEPAFRRQDGSLALDGALALPMRADLIERSGARRGQSRAVVPSQRLDFPPFGFMLEGCEVLVHPFDWSQIGLTLHGADADALHSVLRPWFMAHFDPDDANGADDDGLFGVVHFLSDPVTHDGASVVELDLGSAPVEVFEALLIALAEAGCTQVVVANLGAA